MTVPAPQTLRTTLIRALEEVQRLRAKLAGREAESKQAVAIVGVGLRLPGGVVDLASLWTLLEREVDAVAPVPPERWDAERVYQSDPEAVLPGRSYVREAALLDDVAGFDPAFFNISPREAKAIDPQHRLLLEASWDALETADIVPRSLRDSATGVFVGIGPSDYQLLADPEASDAYGVTGTHMSFAAGRVAFTLGLQGPAMSIDTACSSSLVALHLACASLRAGECELALVGGVQVLASVEPFVQLSQTRALAPDGRCKTFSAAADGYGRGEGVVVLALERLADARAKGRRIYGVVRGSAVNHDGRSSGITAPNGSAQQRVLRAALADAGVEPAQVDYVECHGTGTKLGDPIEVQALSAVYGRARPAERPLLLGAIKTNIGHLESAAGLAGVAKVLAAFEHQRLPSTLHTQPPNPHLDWASLPVEVVSAERGWPVHAGWPHLAAVSGFGLSGTNAHVILEQPPAPEPAPGEAEVLTPTLWLVSARSPHALGEQASQLASWFDARPQLRPLDVEYSLVHSRTHFEQRAAIVAPDSARARAALEALARGDRAPELVRAVAKGSGAVAFLFTGQGAQRLGMGRELHRSLPSFRAAFDEICAELDRHLARPVAEVVFADEHDEAAALLDQTAYTQPALFALEVALARTCEAFGVEPSFVLGHSIGELSAAHVAGVLELDDACRLVAARGRLMQSLPEGGSMVSIQASEAEVAAALEGGAGVEIAGLNGPMSTVISGDAPAVAELAREFSERGRKTRQLVVSHAFHSHHMEPILAEFGEIAASLEFHPPKIPLISNLTGARAKPEEIASAEYWVRHLRGAVRFFDGVRSLQREGAEILLELGPRGVLTSMAAECLDEGLREPVLVTSLRPDRDEREALSRALAELHCHGVAVDWSPRFAEHAPRQIPLPTYPFARERYWLEPRSPSLGSALVAGRYPLSGQRFELPDGSLHFRLEVGPGAQSYLGDHIVYDQIVVPGAFHVAVMLSVAEAMWPGRAIELRGVEFIQALTFDDPDACTSLDVALEPRGDGEPGFEAVLQTQSEQGWSTHATAYLSPAVDAETGATLETSDLRWRDGRAELGALFERVAIEWGPKWWWVDRVDTSDENVVIGELTAKHGVPLVDSPVPAGFIDNSFSLATWSEGIETVDDVPRLPFAIERLVWLGRQASPRYAALRLDRERSKPDAPIADIRYYDAQGRAFAWIEGFSTRAAPAERFLPHRGPRDLWVLEWRPRELGSAGASSSGAVSEGALDELFARLERGERPSRHVVTIRARGRGPLECADEALHLLREWIEDPRLADIELVISTRGAVGLAAGEPCPELACATVWGLVRAAASEHPRLAFRLVDSDDQPSSRATLAACLDLDEPEFALRDGRMYVPRLGAAPAVPEGDPVLDPDRTVLITGATGALGSQLAIHLSERYGLRHLLLVSRSGPAGSRAAELRAACAERGAEVELEACDVSEREALRELLAKIPASRPLGAVIHVAGVVEDGVLPSLERSKLARVFEPKVEAARLLDELTAELPLSAFVLFSSLAGLMGSAGQANYAAANAYLDALATDRRARGLPASSLCWGPWQGEGMAGRLSETQRARMQRQGLTPLSNSEGLALFDACLGRPEAVLAPVRLSPAALPQLERVPAVFRALVPRARPRRAREEVSLGQQLATLAPAQRGERVVALLRAEVASVLGLPDPAEVEADAALSDLGLDSLMAVELRNVILGHTGIKLPATQVLAYPDLSAFAADILDRLELDDEVQAPAQPPVDAESVDEPRRASDSVSRLVQDLRRADLPQVEGRARGTKTSATLTSMMKQVLDAGRSDVMSSLVSSLIEVRRLREAANPEPRAHASPVQLAQGSGQGPQLYCVPSLAIPSNPLQYVRFARTFQGHLRVWGAHNPGYAVGEALPATIDDALELHREALATCTGGEPHVLVGYSSGGFVALDLLRYTAQVSGASSPVGLVLLDTPLLQHFPDHIEHEFIHRSLEYQLQDDSADDEETVSEVTAMTWYGAIYQGDWTIPSTDLPTLYIHARGGFPSPRTEVPHLTDPARNWAPVLPDLTIREIDATHYDLVTGHAEVSAQLILEWLDERGLGHILATSS